MSIREFNTIDIDFKEDYSLGTDLECHQNDSLILNFRVSNYGEVVDLSGYEVELRIRKADGTDYIQTKTGIVKGVDGGLKITTEQALTSFGGNAKGELRVWDSAYNQKTGRTIYIRIIPSVLTPNNTLGETTITALNHLDFSLNKAHDVIDELNDTIVNGENEIASLNSKISEAIRTKGELDATNTTALGTNTTLQGSISTANDRIGSLDTKNALASENIGNLDVRNNTATTNIGDLDTRNTLASQKIGDLDIRNTTASENIGNLDIRNTTASHNINDLDTRNTTASENINSLDSKNTLASQNIEGLDTRNTTATQNMGNLDIKNTLASENIGNLDIRNATANQNIEHLDIGNTLAVQNKQALDSSINTSITSKQALDSSIEQANIIKPQLDVANVLAQESIEAIKNLDTTHIVQDVADIKGEVHSARGEFTNLNDRITEAENSGGIYMNEVLPEITQRKEKILYFQVLVSNYNKNKLFYHDVNGGKQEINFR